MKEDRDGTAPTTVNRLLQVDNEGESHTPPAFEVIKKLSDFSDGMVCLSPEPLEPEERPSDIHYEGICNRLCLGPSP